MSSFPRPSLRSSCGPAVEALTANEIAFIAAVAGDWASTRVPRADELVEEVRALVDRRWSEIAVAIARILIADSVHRDSIRVCLPRLLSAPELIEGLIDLLEDKVDVHLPYIVDLAMLRIASVDQLRRALPLTRGQYDPHLGMYLIGAAVRSFGWTSWLKLHTILLVYPTLAGLDYVEEPAPVSESLADHYAQELRREAWRNIATDEPVRRLAQLIVDLDGALAYSAPDVRGVYVGRLRDAIGSDHKLRAVAIEALLGPPRSRQQDLGLYAATALAKPEDESLILELTSHPDREVGYRASMLQHAVFGLADTAGPWPRPTLTGIAEGLFQIRLEASAHEHAKTWLGDRLLEMMIEHTVASEEERFARDYAKYSESDEEEGLLRTLFGNLAHQFEQLDQALLATARARRSDRRTRVNLSYRSVSKSEEGKPGIRGKGVDDDAAKRFSADLCLIVSPHLEGKALGRRAILVQAKRLYRRDRSIPTNGFESSYKLKADQIDDLTKQTASSFFLFQGPGGAGRGVPILPTQFLSDLAFHQAATRGQIEHAMITAASWSLSEWLTYEVLALRVGDPLEELVAKASGGEGRQPRHLGRFGTVEIEVRAAEPLKEGE